MTRFAVVWHQWGARLAAALGMATLYTHVAVVPPGLAASGRPALVAGTLGRPSFAVALLVALAVVLLLPRLLFRLVPAVGAVCDGARGAAVRPLLWGLSLPVLALLLDPWSFRCLAPALAYAGAVVGGLAAAWRIRALPGARDRVPGGVALAALTLLLLVAALVGWPGPQGDEPHYLLVGQSIARDGDLDLAADYGEGRYRPYHPAPLSPHYKPGSRPGSRYSMHGVGYGLMLVPVVAVSDILGADSPVLPGRAVQLLAYALLVWVLFRFAADSVGRRAAFAGTAVACLSAPMIFAPLHLFPETWLMLLGAGAVLLGRGDGPKGRLAAGVLAALLPWLAIKALPLALVLAIGLPLTYRGDRPRRDLALTTGPVVLSLLLHAGFTWSLYGSLSPSAIYLGADPDFGRQPGYGAAWWEYFREWRGAVRTGIGYFLDQKEGLMFIGPHWILAVAGLPRLWRHRRREVVLLAAGFLAYVGPYALSQQIGGQSPPARPLMAVAWMMALPLGVGLTCAANRLLRWARGGLLVAGLTLTAVFIADPTLLPHDYPVTRSWLLQRLSPRGAGLADWFPLWLNVRDLWPAAVAISWLAVVIGVAWLLVRGAGAGEPAREERAIPRRDSWAAATVAGLVATAMLIWSANVVVSDRHTGAEIAEGVEAWVVRTLPETAWAEPGGVWIRPGAAREIVLTAEPELDDVQVALRTLVDTDVRVELGARVVDPGRLDGTMQVRWRPESGRAWRQRLAYPVHARSATGASPAEVEGGEDHRRLGVFFQLARRDHGGR